MVECLTRLYASYRENTQKEIESYFSLLGRAVPRADDERAAFIRLIARVSSQSAGHAAIAQDKALWHRYCTLTGQAHTKKVSITFPSFTFRLRQAASVGSGNEDG